MSDFQPNWVSRPGETIEDILKDRQISIGTFAERIEYRKKDVEELISGKKEIDNEIAIKLEMVLGASASFWLNREFQYRRNRSRIESENAWLKELPIKDMINFGWITETNDILNACLDFFNVPDIQAWRAKYETMANEYSFRTSNTFYSTIGSLATWLRMGEIKSESRVCGKWNREEFADTLDYIKPLTRKKDPKDFLPQLFDLCANCGVAVVILPLPSGCRASGATKFVSKEKALLMLSFRYLSDDQFWFTFFHEAAHLILHGDKRVFVEGVDDIKNDEELEANLFAGEFLIPHQFESKLSKLTANKRDIITFAQETGVSPGIVIGQLQHRGYFKKSYSNSYKRWYSWDDILPII